MMTLSLLLGDDTVHIELTDGQEIQGEFIGTYMDHVHILTGDRTFYYACKDILSIASPVKEFEYDCSENTVTADILFPPELDPMTGEWASRLPDVFNPGISKPVDETNTNEVLIKTPSLLGNIEIPSKEPISNFWIDNKKNTLKSQQTLNKEEIVEEDFIMINGVRYVKASPDVEIYQDIIPIATIEEVVFQAQQAAQQMEKKTLHQFLGAGCCTLFGVLGLPASILYVELLANSKMDSGNPFYTACDSGQRIVYEQYYKREEKRLRRKSVYGTQGACILMLIGWIVFTEEILSLASD